MPMAQPSISSTSTDSTMAVAAAAVRVHVHQGRVSLVLLGRAQGGPQDVAGEGGRDQPAAVEPAVAVEHQRHRPVGDPQRAPGR